MTRYTISLPQPGKARRAAWGTMIQKIVWKRVKPSACEALEMMFKDCKKIEIPGRGEDVGYFTESMKEKDFADRCALLGEAVLGRIRVE